MAALGLIVVFACEQKDAIEMSMSPAQKNESMTVTILDQKLKVEGAVDGIEKIKGLLSQNSDFDVEYDSIRNNMILAKKAQVEDENLNSDETVFFLVENMPEFPGGESSLQKYISNSIIYPEVAVENGVQGKVFVSFVVTKNGAIANARVVGGVDPALDKEALRVVNTLPKWKPGKQRGQVVNVKFIGTV